MAQFARIQTNVPKGKRHITKSFLIAVGSQHEMTTVLYDRSMPISESVSPKFEDEYHEAKVARDNKRERHTHLHICDNSWAASNVWQKSRRRRCLKWFIRETYKYSSRVCSLMQLHCSYFLRTLLHKTFSIKVLRKTLLHSSSACDGGCPSFGPKTESESFLALLRPSMHSKFPTVHLSR